MAVLLRPILVSQPPPAPAPVRLLVLGRVLVHGGEHQVYPVVRGGHQGQGLPPSEGILLVDVDVITDGGKMEGFKDLFSIVS